ncbi:MAG: exodeoxyribonuclease VII large subunit [Endomicrobium sp.]|nr:exodeoxyribonuclease VII large subunit [Endomicrobium sp.]
MRESFKVYNFGYIYFCVKNENVQLKVIIFRKENMNLSFTSEKGMKVLIVITLNTVIIKW